MVSVVATMYGWPCKLSPPAGKWRSMGCQYSARSAPVKGSGPRLVIVMLTLSAVTSRSTLGMGTKMMSGRRFWT
jgi:hypothetical protein